jgi:biopolymer transport protein ExbD
MDAILSERGPSSKKRPKRLRVDLTPLVDLGFLLITFFMLTTSLDQKTELILIMPKDSPVNTYVPESSTLTFLLQDQNKIGYFPGNQKPVNGLPFASMRKIILAKEKKLMELFGNTNDLVIILRPGKESTYKNLVNALDEIAISGCTRYFVGKSEL